MGLFGPRIFGQKKAGTRKKKLSTREHRKAMSDYDAHAFRYSAFGGKNNKAQKRRSGRKLLGGK